MKNYIIQINYWDGFEIQSSELFIVTEECKRYIVDDVIKLNLTYTAMLKEQENRLRFCYLLSDNVEFWKFHNVCVPSIKIGACHEDEEGILFDALQFINNKNK